MPATKVHSKKKINNLRSIFTVHKSKLLQSSLGGANHISHFHSCLFFSYSQNILKEEEGKFFHFLSESFFFFSWHTSLRFYYYYMVLLLCSAATGTKEILRRKGILLILKKWYYRKLLITKNIPLKKHMYRINFSLIHYTTKVNKKS